MAPESLGKQLKPCGSSPQRAKGPASAIKFTTSRSRALFKYPTQRAQESCHLTPSSLSPSLLDLFILYNIAECFAYMYVCVPHACAVCRLEGVRSPELELGMVVTHLALCKSKCFEMWSHPLPHLSYLLSKDFITSGRLSPGVHRAYFFLEIYLFVMYTVFCLHVCLHARSHYRWL